MSDIGCLTEKLKERLSEKRFTHSLNVMRMAEELAVRYNGNLEKARVAGLLHDCGKIAKGKEILNICMSHNIKIDEISKNEPGLLHAQLGVYFARELYGIEDEEILGAIATHSTGCRDMSLLQKIIFIADYAEPNRKYKGVEEVRKEVFKDLDNALLLAFDRTIKRVIKKGKLLHPDTVGARNYLLLTRT